MGDGIYFSPCTSCVALSTSSTGQRQMKLFMPSPFLWGPWWPRDDAAEIPALQGLAVCHRNGSLGCCIGFSWSLQKIYPPGISKCDLIWNNDLCRCHQGKDLTMRLSWIICKGPESNDKCPYKKKEGALRHTGEMAM